MERNAFFDNAKAVLIFLVVFGHMIAPLAEESGLVDSVYAWIYTFHMPAFILLAGFFAKGAGNKEYILNLTKKLLVPYLIFQVIYTIYYFSLGTEDWYSGLIHPQWSLWFLVSLFSWHMLLILFKKIPAVWSIILAGFIGLSVGYLGEVGYAFSLSRTLVFFPFFLIGYFLTNAQVMKVKHGFVKVGAVIFMTSLFAFLHFSVNMDINWFMSSQSYDSLSSVTNGGLTRIFVYVVAAMMTISVFSLVPSGNIQMLTKIGTKTLYVYILHGFVTIFTHQFEILSYESLYDLFGIAVLSALVVILLSSRTIIALTQPLVELKTKKLKEMLSWFKEV